MDKRTGYSVADAFWAMGLILIATSLLVSLTYLALQLLFRLL